MPVTSALLVYSTVDGHTLSICHRIQVLLEKQGHSVTLVPVEQALLMDCAAFDKVLLGASIRYGKHRPVVYEFVGRFKEQLNQGSSAFFSVSAVARKKGKNVPANNPYFRKFTLLGGWLPRLAATFAGKIDYVKYNFAE